MKAVFLEKDGALTEWLPAGATEQPAMQSGAQPAVARIGLRAGAAPALRLLARLDFRLFVVADRPPVAAGADQAALEAIGDRLHDLLLREQLALDGFYYCTHLPLAGATASPAACHCRKPRPGLLLRAAHEHGIDLTGSWLIGAVLDDIEAGNRAGCRTVLVDNGSETGWRLGPRRVPTRMAPDLYMAAVLIASHGEEE